MSRGNRSGLRSVAFQASFRLRPSRTCKPARLFELVVGVVGSVLVLVFLFLQISGVVEALEARETLVVWLSLSFASAVEEASSLHCRLSPAKEAALDQTISALAHPVEQAAVIAHSSADLLYPSLVSQAALGGLPDCHRFCRSSLWVVRCASVVHSQSSSLWKADSQRRHGVPAEVGSSYPSICL